MYHVVISLFLYLFLALFYGFFMVIWCSRFYKILRNPKFYYGLLAISVMPVLFYAIFNHGNFNVDRIAVLTFFPLISLILYQVFDRIILRIFGHHIYFQRKYSSDFESAEAGWLEFFFQMILVLCPFLLLFLDKILRF